MGLNEVLSNFQLLGTLSLLCGIVMLTKQCRSIPRITFLTKRANYLVLFIIVLSTLSLQAQSDLESKNIFVRVYNLQNLKINKGKLVSIDDNSIILKRNQRTETIDIREIGTIKTKRAIGHNLVFGAAAGATAGAIYGFAQGDDGALYVTDSGGDNALVYGTLGLALGTVVGGLTQLGKNPETFEIDGKSEKLLSFKEAVSNEN